MTTTITNADGSSYSFIIGTVIDPVRLNQDVYVKIDPYVAVFFNQFDNTTSSGCTAGVTLMSSNKHNWMDQYTTLEFNVLDRYSKEAVLNEIESFKSSLDFSTGKLLGLDPDVEAYYIEKEEMDRFADHDYDDYFCPPEHHLCSETEKEVFYGD